MCTARVVGTGLRVPPVPPLGWAPDADGATEGGTDADAGALVLAGELGAGLDVAALVGAALTEAGAVPADVVGPAACDPLPPPQAVAARAITVAMATAGLSERAAMRVRGKGTDLLEQSCGSGRFGQCRSILRGCVFAVPGPARRLSNPHEW
jgi:hypothetical protein